MRVLAVIPARGGSKGIPGKNLREVAGAPLLTWTIRQALASRYAAAGRLHVLVSTDDPAIAETARAAGADMLDRPAALAQDDTPTEPVVWHAITAARQADADAGVAEPFEAVLLLQATSPIRLPGTIDRALEQFESSGVDSLVGVVPTPIFLWAPSDGADPSVDPHADPHPGPCLDPVALYPWQARPRRQDLRPQQLRYRETGSLYVTRTELYRPGGTSDGTGTSDGNRLGGRIGLFVMDELEGVDIDTELDLQVADALLRGRPGGGAGAAGPGGNAGPGGPAAGSPAPAAPGGAG